MLKFRLFRQPHCARDSLAFSSEPKILTELSILNPWSFRRKLQAQRSEAMWAEFLPCQQVPCKISINQFVRFKILRS